MFLKYNVKFIYNHNGYFFKCFKEKLAYRNKTYLLIARNLEPIHCIIYGPPFSF